MFLGCVASAGLHDRPGAASLQRGETLRRSRPLVGQTGEKDQLTLNPCTLPRDRPRSSAD